MLNRPAVLAWLTIVAGLAASTSAEGQSSGAIREASTASVAFTDDPLAPGATAVKAFHFTELRDAANAARNAAGLEPRMFTDGSLTGTFVKALHILELRTAVESVRTARGLPPFAYADPGLSAGTTIKALHVQELREVYRRLIDGCPPISMTNPARTTYTVDTPMTATFTQSGAAEGVTFSVAGGELPAGVALSSSGNLAGTPTETGTFPITITAADRYGCRETSATYALTIVPPPTISSFTGPAGPVGPGATFTLAGVFSGGGGLITSNQGHDFVAVSGTEYQLTATVDTVFTLTVTNAAGDQVAASLTVDVADISGIWRVTPTILYSCAFGFVNLNISQFRFATSGSSLTVTGAPVTMVGAVTGSSFSVTGSLAGSVTETYALSGVFNATLTGWTGTFEARFTGAQTDCRTQSFAATGSR